MMTGVGFSPAVGGPLRYADESGIGQIVDRMESWAAVAGRRFEPCALLSEMKQSSRRFSDSGQ
jgi:3-hydroxyacyl-CoA dehydrogenase